MAGRNNKSIVKKLVEGPKRPKFEACPTLP